MSAFLAIAADVPRKIRSGWLLWIFLILILLALGFFAIPLGKSHDPNGTEWISWWGQDMRAELPDHTKIPVDMEKSLGQFVGGFFGEFLACYFGVFAGLVLLADAVSSAFAPGQAELNLPKPVNRASIVVARHVGAIAVASFFATLLVGGAVLIAYIRTGIFVADALVFIPTSVAIFGVLHAIGAIAGAWIQNALFAAFGSALAWIASIATNIPNIWVGYEKMPYPLLVKALDAVKILHRILPRSVDLPGLASRLVEHKLAEPPRLPRDEIELAAQTLVWWGVALVLAVLVVRRRDF